jgi:cyclic pyranopterin phosphate synthase
VRFIEFMPLDADHADARQRPARRRHSRDHRTALPLEPVKREPHATARLPLRRRHGSIGFINPVSEPFCGDCTASA